MSQPGTQRTFYKDLQQLHKTIETSTDGQAEIIGIDEMTVRVALKPKTGYNAHAVFAMTIQCQGAYPRTVPKVTFNSPIFHPNIDAKMGYICLSLLNEWQSCWSLLDVVKAMLYLIEHPNFDSANNGYAHVDDISELEMKTKLLLAGLEVNGCVYPANEAWCEWARENNCLLTEEDEKSARGSESQMPSTSKCTGNGEREIKDDDNPHISLPKIEEINIDENDDYSVASSETAPSCAKIRYSVDLDEQSYEKYPRIYESVESASQRVVIWDPTDEKGVYKKTIYYFLEILCDAHHNEELGNSSHYLYCGNQLREDQSNPDSCQTSSSCCWYPVYSNNFDYSYVDYGEYEASMDLGEFFNMAEPHVDRRLTRDFCPWALEDGLGCRDIFGRLFFDGDRRGSDFECFLFADDESYQGSDGFRHLFNLGQSEEDEECDGDATVSDTFDMETELEDTERDNEEEVCVEENKEVENEPENGDHDGQLSILSKSTESYYEEYKAYRLMHECTYCNYHEQDSANISNLNLHPQFMWLFRRTRWSIRFAPQQSVNLSMEGIKIPPWRASTARLLLDICRYCKVNKEAENVVLLDPMALSPLSPVLNLMRYKKGPIPRLTGVLWMTPVDAISPFYRVPIPTVPNAETNYPGPFSLRVLALGAFAANWVAWLSRIETSAALGITRFSPFFLGKSIAACVLQPFNLGCGQSSLLELWPLWLLRNVLKSSLCLSKLKFQPGPRDCDLNFFFPFSDLDEI
ncbi:hypothetical protein ACTXT7_017102 [Hymenolepis weldensis]